MKLYDHAWSPNCRKVRAVAYELGIELEHVEVDIFHGASRLPPFLAKNANGRVPVLEDGELLLWESNAIMAYLAADSPLLPTERRARAEVDRWLSWQLAHLWPAFRTVAYERVVKKLTGRGEPDPAVAGAAAQEFAKLSAVLDDTLARAPYVATTLSIADFGLATPYALADACALDLTPYPSLRAWLGRMYDRPSMKRALADAQQAMAA
jgi:glutathione S-transferase